MSKRRRTDDDSIGTGGGGSDIPAPEPPNRRSEEVWLDDGNIVLQADHVQFKVHCSVLAKHSPIFADLFKVPHPPDEPTVDGCPIVELQDSSEDLKHLLLALYGDRVYFMPNGGLHFLVIAAMIRLGRKYEIDHLRDHAFARLKCEFPATLEEQDKLHLKGWTQFSFARDETYDDHCKQIALMVHLAHACALNSILPVLYFQYVANSVEDIFGTGDGPPIPYLAMRRCLIGRTTLTEARLNQVHRWVRVVGSALACENKEKCTSTSREISEILMEESSLIWDIFYPWADFVDNLSIEGRSVVQRLCNPCAQQAKKLHQNAREDVWRNLPSIFVLPEWQDLKDFDV